MIVPFELVAVTDAIRSRKTQTHIAERDSLTSTGDLYLARYGHRPSISRNALNVGDRRSGVSAQPRRIHHGYAAVEREPNPPCRIGDHGPVPLDAFKTAQAVREPVFVYILVLERPLKQLLPIYSQHMGGRCHPQRSHFVLCHTQNLFPESSGCSER